MTYILGHDQHGHPITTATECLGTITTCSPGHGEADNLFAVFVAEHTDAPSDPARHPRRGIAQVILEPTPAT